MELVDYNGKTRKLSDFSARWWLRSSASRSVRLPDLSLAELAEAMKKLGADADRVQVLLITVDPERDTPDILKQCFDPRWPDRHAGPGEGRRPAYYAKAPTKDGGYSMDHTAAFYLLDGKGESRVLANNNIGWTPWCDIQALLKG